MLTNQNMSLQDKIAFLQWHIQMGIDEIIGEKPVNHLSGNVLEEKQVATKQVIKTQPAPQTTPLRPLVKVPVVQQPADAVKDALGLVAQVKTLTDLEEAMLQFHHCPYRKTARNLVFADGNPEAWLMIVGEAPGNEEDIKGKPFVGKSGQLLDRIFFEAGIARANNQPQKSFYITNSINWRPPANRNPTRQEIEMFRPFIWKHIELIGPKILVLTGNIACSAILNQQGITKLRGKWLRIDEMAVMPTVHPAFLLRNPTFKQYIWQDVLAIRKKLGELERNE